MRASAGLCLQKFFAEIVVKKSEVKPDEDMGYCSEVLSVCNYSEEIITKR